MEDTPKPQTQIEIKPIQPQKPRNSVELTAEELLKQKLPFPFFRPLSQRKENTWVISLFVILHTIAFAATMILNDCWSNSHGQCALKPLGRFSFQPLSENPFLGPSASALDEMGAIRQIYLAKEQQFWRVFTSPCLHAGVFHLIINLTCVIYVGIHLEQEFGPLRIGIIYIVSALTGSLVATLFLQDRPSVTSSSALFGLLGAILSGLIRNWNDYSKKLATLVSFCVIFTMNFIVGLMPYVNNFSNIGGFFSGFLLGFVLLFKPQLGTVYGNKGGLFEYDGKHSVKLKQKLDRPVLRSISLVIFILLLSGAIVAVGRGVNVNEYCKWCQYIDCVPFEWWSCGSKTAHCETMVVAEHLTLTCSGNGKFRVFPFSSLSQPRIEDLCNLICS